MPAAPLPLGYNTYCLRSLRWPDARHLGFAAEQKLDAIFLQDSLDPRAADPAHWKEVGETAERLGLHLETGGSGLLPRTAEGLDTSIATLRRNIERAAAMGSRYVRGLLASNRASLPTTVEQSVEWALKILRSVRQDLSGRGMKVIIEVHKDLQAWELRQVIEAAGTDVTGVYLDTGNPVFVLEHPMTTFETLWPYVQSVHLRDSAIYMHPKGVAVQWVPLGEGIFDFKTFVAAVAEKCPNVHVYNKPITGRPPEVIPYLDPNHWKSYPGARAAELARFLDWARTGRPYEGHVVIEDLANRQTPPQFLEAVQFQQRDHVLRGLDYAKKELGLGRRWRAA
ncbi:MAG: sugar phosphate isomerase/epimerase [Acidobacteria bacterium]|nr:sugar phosphate isomerase/epimerase [Acidobacteriota bacterium]